MAVAIKRGKPKGIDPLKCLLDIESTNIPNNFEVVEFYYKYTFP